MDGGGALSFRRSRNVKERVIGVLKSRPRVMRVLDYSFAGRIGHAMTAIFAPLGFNWQICIALIPGLAAREVAVDCAGRINRR